MNDFTTGGLSQRNDETNKTSGWSEKVQRTMLGQRTLTLKKVAVETTTNQVVCAKVPSPASPSTRISTKLRSPKRISLQEARQLALSALEDAEGVRSRQKAGRD